MKKLFLLALSAFPILAYAQVGIGIATPTAKLDINGDLKIRQVTVDHSADPNRKVLAVDANGLVGFTTVGAGGNDNWGTQVANTVGPITGDGSGTPIGLIPGTAQGQTLIWDATLGQWVLQVVPTSGDNWGTQVAVTQGPITGTGITGSPIGLIPGTAQGQTLIWDATLGQWVLQVVPTSGDNWGTQVAVTQGPITGTGITGSPIGLIPGTAQGQTLIWDATLGQWVLQVVPTSGDNWGTQVANTAGPITGDGSGTPIGLIPGTTQGQTLVWDATLGQWVLQVPAGDNWGTQVAVTQGPIIGTGVTGSPIGLTPGLAPEQILQWNNTTSQWEIVDFPGWKLVGNFGTTPGTGNNYVGTNDNADLAFATVATEKMRLTQSGNLGIGTTNPISKLQVGNDNTTATANIFALSQFVNANNVNNASLVPTGSGTRFMWISEKASLRTGGLSAPNGNWWDSDSIGNYSFAAGYDVKATNLFSFTVGNSSSATAIGSTALGKFVSTDHQGSFQIGDSPDLPTQTLYSSREDQFSARFKGGYRFFSDHDDQDTSGIFISGQWVGQFNLENNNFCRLGVGVQEPRTKLEVRGKALISSLDSTNTRPLIVANNHRADRWVVADSNGVLATVPVRLNSAGTGISVIQVGNNSVISTVPHTGDVIGTVGLTVVKIQGVNVSSAFPSSGQVMRFNSGTNRWEPFSGYSGSVTVKGSSGSDCTMTYENGLLISTTCP